MLVLISVLVVLALISIGWVIGGYNTLVGGSQNIKTMLSNVKTEYQRRADLLYNLAESVKSYAKFEKNTLVEVIAMRNGNFGKNIKDLENKKKTLDNMLSKLMVVVEKYPELKASSQYQQLMDELRNTEDRVNIARTEYNDTVREYNLFVISFPSRILAKKFKFSEEGYFENEQNTDKCPKLDLSKNLNE